jgi:hypothetical protein
MQANDIIDDFEDERDEYDTLIESVSRLQVSGDEGTEHDLSADEACELMCDIVREQFWEWFLSTSHGRRFKPRVRVYEVRDEC